MFTKKLWAIVLKRRGTKYGVDFSLVSAYGEVAKYEAAGADVRSLYEHLVDRALASNGAFRHIHWVIARLVHKGAHLTY